MSTDSYLLAGKDRELERLQQGSRMLEPAGRRLLAEIGDGQGARAVDVGCGALGWLRLLSEWVGPDGQVIGTDIQDEMLAAARQFVTAEGLGNVTLVNDDLFASQLEPASFDLVHARALIFPLGRGPSRWPPTCGWSVPAAPWFWKRSTPPPCTTSRARLPSIGSSPW